METSEKKSEFHMGFEPTTLSDLVGCSNHWATGDSMVSTGQIKNIFEKEKKFDSRTWFFLENSSLLGVFWPRRGLQANHGTVRKSAIFPQPGNQKRLKWSNNAYVNKWSFAFKIKFCVFEVTETCSCMKVVLIFNTQPVKIPHFKSLLTRKRARWPHFFIAFF